MEIFSDKPECQSEVVESFSNFDGVGKTLSLLDDQILLVGGDLNATKHTYISIQNPRRGLHAMKYSIEKFPLGGSPHNHASFVSGNRLLVLGGAHRTKAKFEDFTWNSLDLRKPDGTKFTSVVSSPCTVKISRDEYLILGGEIKGPRDENLIPGGDEKTKTIAIDSVFKINITSEEVQILSPMLTKRMKHSCEKLSKDSVLISGGKASFSENPLFDEIYRWTSIDPIDVSSSLEERQTKSKGSIGVPIGDSLRRYQHKLVRIEENIFALGGLNEKDKESTSVMKFNPSCVDDNEKDCWSPLKNKLKFKKVANLAVTSFPQSAIDCGIDCQCGIESKTRRIVGGAEVEVKQTCQFNLIKYFTGSTLPMDCSDDNGQEQRCFIC